ncbi:GL23163 [Drosophila persimilis]|uniref:GL23163 n=1 Tax=Drosophila persimilis TaxID=7234 RepID=B4G5H9_DROPE|nr:GL23163 [Drosophila persimilis]
MGRGTGQQFSTHTQPSGSDDGDDDDDDDDDADKVDDDDVAQFKTAVAQAA